MSTALLVCAAPLPDAVDYYRTLIIGHPGRVVAVDAGGDLCRQVGRTPDLLIGDLDSIGHEARAAAESAGARVVAAPTRKDVTDLDLALNDAYASGESGVIVTAAWSGRLDHTLAAVGSVLGASHLVIDVLDPHTTGCVLDSAGRRTVALDGPGSTFSLFTIDPTVRVTCEGVRYPLRSASLEPLSSRGLSNVVLGVDAYVTADHGRVLLLSHAVGSVGPAGIREHA